MERDYANEIDNLKAEVAEIKKLLEASLTGQAATDTHTTDKAMVSTGNTPADKDSCGIYVPTNAEIMEKMHPDKNLCEKMISLCEKANAGESTGMITYLGVFASGGRQSNWIKDGVHTDDLLTLVENHTAEKVLHCLGNSDRLNILLAILKKPMSVAELVQTCGLNTTGQAYHHMKPLLTADLITEDEHSKGVYIVQPHKVQGIIMLLAGICDMIDETYTKGCWETE